MAVQHAASQSKTLLAQLNKSPQFWNTHGAACQTAAYITLGRIFDTKSKFNVHTLLSKLESSLGEFSIRALAGRKQGGEQNKPSWLTAYLSTAYVPSKADVQRLRKAVARYEEIYLRAVQPARHKHFAHREKHERVTVAALFDKGKVGELWRLVAFLRVLYQALWQLYHNGRKPSLRLPRYSVRAMYASPAHGGSPSENIVADTKMLMDLLLRVNA